MGCRDLGHYSARPNSEQKVQIHIDHIDPRWKEGRDYQLVCGLDNDFNFCERDPSTNSSKSNRFLPWRVAAEEVGSVPINPGDLCLFLNRETGEWVLEEFMGNWWFSQTRNLCGESQSGRRQAAEGLGCHAPGVQSKASKSQSKESKQKGGKAVFEKKVGLGALTREQLSKQGSLPWWHNPLTQKTCRSHQQPSPEWVRGRGPMVWLHPQNSN
jgi:hypothetical protein